MIRDKDDRHVYLELRPNAALQIRLFYLPEINNTLLDGKDVLAGSYPDFGYNRTLSVLLENTFKNLISYTII